MAVKISAYPYRGYQTSEAEYSLLLNAAIGGSGLRTAATCTIAGMTPTISAVDGFIRGHRFMSAAGALTPFVAASTQRVASVIARLDYTKSPDIVTYDIVYGDATAPRALTQTDTGVFELRLFDVTVPANAVSLAATAARAAYSLHRSPSSAVILVQEAEPVAPEVGTIWIW